jgi:transposase
VIQITPQMRILVAVDPVDFRKGIDGLARQCRQVLQSDPFSGALFIFRNRSAKAIKILAYDGQGFWLCQKRLSTGRFRFWPGGDEAVKGLQAHELQVLLSAGNPEGTQAPPPWRRVSP